ncbi:four-carbon acid sugar kinase family protein (plasmid) [Rhizobium lusitanum]|uniref:four-carbon acid sugar kinase family protein n=1 Tax=Rhizobium lusitanum TaxID=293958 RepID=UPI00160A726E|nr:four-carbon acid sugar kinase family protein [Rhizobium lusitanum]QND45733.1 four-carbon acid sugar kinase family protein [Rhizobium lusitanum]
MTLKVAIIADDLTGALDTGTPFVEAGLSVTVAIDIDAIPEALASRSEVVVINTDSRALSAEDAVERVRLAANALLAAAPDIILKKIDSRLKGHVAAESAALAAVFGHREIVLAPAIPDQQRFTRDGKVVGRGVDYPLPIAKLFEARPETVLIIDAESDDDLDRLMTKHDWTTTLAVGARGIGSALARHVGQGSAAGQAFVPTGRTLFAFGSRDPITATQMATLEASGSLRATVDAPMGLVECDKGQMLPLLLRCTGDITQEAMAVADRFAKGVTSVIEDTHPDMLMMGGGDTAVAVFRALGIRLLTPKGEIEAGIPWFDVTMANGNRLRCAVKSGGFGNSDSLLRLIPQNQAA